jgi:hypothetical protein
MFAVIKASGVPQLMSSPGSVMEVLIKSTVKAAQPLDFVRHGVGVYDVHANR